MRLKKIFMHKFFWGIFATTALACTLLLYNLSESRFTFFQDPVWATWMLCILIGLLPILTYLLYKFLSMHRSLLHSERNIFTMMENHQQTRKLSSAKSIYLATISHEIRNPLQAILGTHELLLKDATLKSDSKALILGAYKTSKSLLEMLNQVLDLSKIESGKVDLEPVPTSVQELLLHITESFQGLCDHKANTLKVHLDSILAQSLMIDRTRLQQVLANLISNSIKFTQNGVVYIAVNILNDTHAEQLLHFQVIDTGCGIPEEDLVRIIEPFERSEALSHKNIPGTGLGLSITAAILRSMDSQLQLESTPHLGTSASFRIRFRRSSSLPIATYRPFKLSKIDPQQNVFTGKTALIVDDYPACREIISQQLHYFGFRCLQSDHAQEGLHILERHSIDLVITDEFMPDITGRQFALKIHANYPATKVMVLTGDTQFANKLSPEEMHFISAFMIKPIELHVLFQTLKRVFLTHHYQWDFNRLLDFTNQNENAARSILQSILDTQKEIAVELQKQTKEIDISILIPLCHKILGGAKLIHAENLIHDCQAIRQSHDKVSALQVHQIYQVVLTLNHQIQEYLLQKIPL